MYKWLPVTYCWGYPRDGLASNPREEEILLIASFHSHWLRADNMGDLWPATRVGLYRYTPGCKENVNENLKFLVQGNGITMQNQESNHHIDTVTTLHEANKLVPEKKEGVGSVLLH